MICPLSTLHGHGIIMLGFDRPVCMQVVQLILSEVRITVVVFVAGIASLLGLLGRAEIFYMIVAEQVKRGCKLIIF